MSNIYFTPKKMAKITGGYWENYDKKLQVKEFHHTYHYLKKGDAFVVISDNWPSPKAYKSNEHKIKGAIKKGISAIIVQKDLDIDTDIPVLRVENSYFAIKELAKYASKKTNAKKVLITGSYGKTGFKTHLHHILKDQVDTYVRLNSANFSASSYCNLASIKQNNKLFLMEIPIANREKMTRRSELISPDVCVVTSIGHEGIERWKSINRIIRYKLLIAKGLSDGGKLLLPYDDKYYSKILKEAQNYKQAKILTYGSSSECNAYFLHKHFTNFGWDVVAKIENTVVAYRVPFFEEYAVSSSLGELLCAYHLGIDVHEAANKYYGCTNFKSSGILYNVEYKNKSFYLYDQSNRGGIEGYESFFKTLSYIELPKGGKKILVTSEFVDYEDGEMENIDIPYFQQLIDDSEVEELFSVEKFSEHINVLKDKSIWKNHSIDFNNIKDEIMSSVKDNDLVCVKGIFESELPEFIEYIKNLDGIKIQEFVSTNSMQEENFALKGLKTIEPSDIQEFQRAVDNEDKKGWVYYFPFLYFWSLSQYRELLIEKKEDAINLFLLDKFYRDTKPRIQLYIPTLTEDISQQEKAIKRIFKYKGYETANIVWVDREDVARLTSLNLPIKFNYKTFEYMYDPKKYNDLSGGKLRNLRLQINRMLKHKNISIVPYEAKYKEQCLQLHERWNQTQKEKYDSVSDEKYTRNCIEHFDKFNKEDLNGLIILQNDKVMSFGFVGKISSKLLSFFIGKSDHSLKSVQSYLKYKLMLENQEYELTNDGPGISEGLDSSKRMFRPVIKHKVYRARIQ